MSNASSPNSPNTPAKPRLTEAEKRDNHIKSEKKRREAIRAGFDRLCDIVPDMQGQGRSEAVVLQATVEYTREQIAKKAWIKQKAMQQGWSSQEVEEAYRQAEAEVRKREEQGLGMLEGGERPSHNGGVTNFSRIE